MMNATQLEQEIDNLYKELKDIPSDYIKLRLEILNTLALLQYTLMKVQEESK